MKGEKRGGRRKRGKGAEGEREVVEGGGKERDGDRKQLKIDEEWRKGLK